MYVEFYCCRCWRVVNISLLYILLGCFISSASYSNKSFIDQVQHYVLWEPCKSFLALWRCISNISIISVSVRNNFWNFYITNEHNISGQEGYKNWKSPSAQNGNTSSSNLQSLISFHHQSGARRRFFEMTNILLKWFFFLNIGLLLYCLGRSQNEMHFLCNRLNMLLIL